MGIKIRLCEPLSQYAMSRRNLNLGECATVSDAFDELERLYPGIARRILDDQDNLRKYVNVFLNGKPIESHPSVVRLAKDDELFIVQSVAGG